MRRSTEKGILWGALYFIVVAFFLGMAAGHSVGVTDTNKRLVYSICNQSRMSAEIKETQCGDLQDQTHTEFLCIDGNTSPDNICWVEQK